MPKISIITATYNSEKTLEAAINSLNSQTFTDIEHIIVDGKSSDSTVELAKRSSKHLTTIISEPDNGIYDALNKGIMLSKGEFIGFLHSDDLLDNSTTIQSLVDRIEQNKLDAVYGDLQYVNKNNTKIIRRWKSGNFHTSKLKSGWMPPHPTFYMKRELYDKYGSFDTNFRIAADYDSLLRYLSKNDLKIGYLAENIVKMRVGGESNKSIRNIIRKSKEDYKVLQKNGISPYWAIAMKNLRKIPQFIDLNLK